MEGVLILITFIYAIFILMTKPKVISIVGPTASGKSALAIDLALIFNGEVISADSRQVYRELDLGSGKVTTKEMKGVPHHLLNVANLDYIYTGADFIKDANLAISDILNREKLPIIAGGTFFYIELLKGESQSAPVEPNPTLRAELEQLSDEQLFAKLNNLDPERAQSIDSKNRRRLVRALEIIDSLGKVPTISKKESDFDFLTIGIRIDKDILKQRIEQRLSDRLEKGMVEEVENLLKNGISPVRLHDLGLEYRYITEYLEGKITYEKMKEKIVIKSLQFAKRQYTWLKRDKSIVWFDFPVTLNKIENTVNNFLAITE